MNENLIYRVADTFQTDLFQMGKQIRGVVPEHKFHIARNWTLKSDITLVVDENTEKMVTAFARILGNLWAYLVVINSDSWILFFDGSRVKIRQGAEKEFGLGSSKATLERIKPSVSRVFHRHQDLGSGARWEPINLADLGL